MPRVSLPIRVAARPPDVASRDRALALVEARALDRPEELSGETDSNVLEWLALNGGPQTRRAVAANPATPVQAYPRLAADAYAGVRTALAVRIGRLAAESDTLPSYVRETLIEVVSKLASDTTSRVRAALSPVLECSPLVSDADLLKTIVTGRSPATLSLIARRPTVSEDVCDAIALVQDEDAVKVLLENRNAKIRVEALDHLAEQADAVAEWHAPLAAR
jgi:uncharacterized protein (DUF2336 family)